MGLPLPAALTPGLSDHLCHAYDGSEALCRQAAPYLAAGRSLGQRAVVVAPAGEAALAREIATAVASDVGTGPGAEVLELRQDFGRGPIDVAATLQSLDTVLGGALDQGCTGLRVVALLTQIAIDPGLRQSLAAWEHALGEWQSVRPVAWACSFDRAALGDKAVHELACLHPRVVTSGPAVPFQLYFRGGQLVLEGEIDSFSAPLLSQALAHVRAVPGERLMIDARGLTFVNHRGVVALVDGLARRCGGVTLLGGPPLVHRLCIGMGVSDEVLDVLPCPW
jgi:anti-anti-sigma regulatory factor